MHQVSVSHFHSADDIHFACQTCNTSKHIKHAKHDYTFTLVEDVQIAQSQQARDEAEYKGDQAFTPEIRCCQEDFVYQTEHFIPDIPIGYLSTAPPVLFA